MNFSSVRAKYDDRFPTKIPHIESIVLFCFHRKQINIENVTLQVVVVALLLSLLDRNTQKVKRDFLVAKSKFVSVSMDDDDMLLLMSVVVTPVW